MLRRTSLSLDRYIVSPVRWDVTGPVCDLCNEVVDREGIVEGYPGECDAAGRTIREADSTFCKVLVTHHGCEELRHIDFGSVNWTCEDLKKAMQRVRWFSPEDGGHAEEGTLSVQVPA